MEERSLHDAFMTDLLSLISRNKLPCNQRYTFQCLQQEL